MTTREEWLAFLAARPDIDRLLDAVSSWNIAANEGIMAQVDAAWKEWLSTHSPISTTVERSE